MWGWDASDSERSAGPMESGFVVMWHGSRMTWAYVRSREDRGYMLPAFCGMRMRRLEAGAKTTVSWTVSSTVECPFFLLARRHPSKRLAQVFVSNSPSME
jgi:hypothetical protein